MRIMSRHDDASSSARLGINFSASTIANYTATRKDLVATANDLFEVVGSGKVKIAVNQTYPLAEAARAHRDLEARLTTGSTVLLPVTPPEF